MALTTTTLLHVASFAVVNGTLETVPKNGGPSVTQNTYRGLKVVISLPTADKLAVGNTLALNAFLSPDNGVTWNFVNGFTWTSYGPTGLTITDPDGTVHVNPDPTLYVPLNNITAQEVARLQYLAKGLSTAGVDIFGVS